MVRMTTAALAVAVLVGCVGVSTAVEARTLARYGVYNHRATVMSNIYQAQQQNNAAISHVQNNIRSTQPKVY